MIRRTAVAGLATAALASTSLLLAGPAHAADPAECTITDVLPQQAVIGIVGQRVQLGVTTTCDDQDIKFSVRGRGLGTSAHGFWIAACNYRYSGPANYDCGHDGSGIVNPIPGTTYGYDFIPGNDLAGPNPIYATAFIDVNQDSYQNTGDISLGTLGDTLTLLRQTTFDRTFNAAPEPVRQGKPIKVSATLSTADWNTGTWTGLDADVKVQFKAAHQKSYHTVKTVTATAGELKTSVKATRSGYWRAVYAGTGTLAASTSGSDYVKVRAAH
ncbi:hypothetical protein [Kineosporia sp. NBRC 101731]|uniref:hypothetical protein n=1 Tax=Kineosporia sp. NBRC 101731 TaxID=3032199 RepID=UPI0024A040C5|nr:hypothetical protein [Kineosporia sp. NBRC 101731]GLY33933.1 hypothetical protein Kisp02_72980 [Kineosporia sp. NBRC 101731]